MQNDEPEENSFKRSISEDQFLDGPEIMSEANYSRLKRSPFRFPKWMRISKHKIRNEFNRLLKKGVHVNYSKSF